MPAATCSLRWRTRAHAHELTDDDHRHLAAALHQLAGMAVVSGYPCALYCELYAGWTMVARPSVTHVSTVATEALWLSPVALAPGDEAARRASAWSGGPRMTRPGTTRQAKLAVTRRPSVPRRATAIADIAGVVSPGARRLARGQKYHAVRTEYRGEWYASKGEAAYAARLDGLLAAGQIGGWRRGRPWVLLDAPRRRDRITLCPDFEVWDAPEGAGFRVVDFRAC